MVLVLSIISAMFIFKFIVSRLNYQYSIKGVPENVKHIYDEDAYKKWLSYYRDQRKFGLITKTFDFVVIILLLAFQVFGSVESLIGEWTSDVYLQTLLFLGVYYMVATLLDLPFSYYQTFAIEEKYGFNQSSKKTFFIDQFKQLLLVVILFGALVFGLHALFNQFQNDVWIFVLGAWVALTLVMILMFLLNTKVFVKLFNKLTPLEDGSLKTKIDELASSLGFEIDNISVMDASRRSSKLNAFFSGLGKHRDIVLYDTLIDKMEEDQIVAVLGHELSHALNKDTFKMLGMQIATFLIYASLIGVVLTQSKLYTDFGLSGVHFGFAIILFSLLIEPISMLLSIPSNYVSRIAEYRADRFGAKHVSKEAMMTALEVLARENFSNLNPHPLFEKLYYNHPSISKRLASIKSS